VRRNAKCDSEALSGFYQAEAFLDPVQPHLDPVGAEGKVA
jgi:hypothetical protein